ncbi:MAG: lactate utilization protein, partial [Rhizobiales bacterium]|nr:lactate utilization protein [Hyphomicrobiales bacterium]
MEAGSVTFPANVTKALADTQLQHAMTETGPRFIAKRAKAREALPEFDRLRDISRDIKNHVLDNLDIYLEHYEKKVTEIGGQVHWAATAEDARQAIIGICKGAGAKIITKGKSMISEEIDLNEALEKAGMTPVETDLGEYLIQLRHERPSHISAPAG